MDKASVLELIRGEIEATAAVKLAFHKAAKYDAMMTAGPVQYESRIVYDEDYKNCWISHSQHEFNEVKERKTRYGKPLEFRLLYALENGE